MKFCWYTFSTLYIALRLTFNRTSTDDEFNRRSIYQRCRVCKVLPDLCWYPIQCAGRSRQDSSAGRILPAQHCFLRMVRRSPQWAKLARRCDGTSINITIELLNARVYSEMIPHVFISCSTSYNQAHHSERLQEMKKNNPQLDEVEIKPEKFVYHVSDDKLHGWAHGIYSIHMKDASGSEFKQEKARFSYTCHRMQGQGPWKIAHAHISQAHKSQA